MSTDFRSYLKLEIDVHVIFWRSRVQISVRRPTIMTEVFNSSFEATAVIVRQIWPLFSVSTSFLTQYSISCFNLTLYKNSVALVCKQIIPAERPPLVGEVSTNFTGQRVSRGQRNQSPRPLIFGFLDRSDAI
jgi:hypothetical protein